MKNLLFLLLAIFFCLSCDDIEDNTPGFQANLEENFFKANDSKGIRREGNSYTIQGITNNEIITLKVKKSQVGEYLLGEGSENFAIYEDISGNIYSTSFGGNGKIVISRKNTGQQFFTGTFNFIAINPGIDTLVVDQGVFYQVYYDFNPGDLDEDTENNANYFIAQIDGVSFNPFSVIASTSQTSINILASSPNKEIKIKTPLDVQAGSYLIQDAGFSASFILDGNENSANEGTIIIIDNDIIERRIRGTFSFETDNNSISQGQFRIFY